MLGIISTVLIVMGFTAFMTASQELYEMTLAFGSLFVLHLCREWMKDTDRDDE